jgi:predicted O-methyltransferase YrrM
MNSLQKAGRLSFRLVKIAMTRPRRLSHILGAALAASSEVVDPSCDLLGLPRIGLKELLPESGGPWNIEIALFPKTYASILEIELLALLVMMKIANAKNVFEFGTYKGVSVTQFALNADGQSRIYTLDLPEQTQQTELDITDPDEARIAREPGKGSLVPPELRSRITFLREDSALFDDTPYAGGMDFVFVDGAHSYAYVKNDSEKGWRMLRKGGIIAWHDFRPDDPDVVRYLLKCPFQPTLVGGTTIAFARKS